MPTQTRSGRKEAPGSKLPSRFKVIYFCVLQFNFRYNNNQAGRSAVALAERNFVLADTASGLRFFSPIDRDDFSGNGIQKRADAIARRAWGYVERANSRRDPWFNRSIGGVYAWFHATLREDIAEQEQAIHLLRTADQGWRAELEALRRAALSARLVSFKTTQDRERLPKRLNSVLLAIRRAGGKDDASNFCGGSSRRKSGRRRS